MERALQKLVWRRAGNRCEYCKVPRIGITPGGRAAVRVLKINLDHRVGLRRELIEEGVFPPA